MSTPIRAKFIEHMEFLGLSKQTQRSYINGVKGLAKYHNESPDKLTNDQVRSYFRHLLLERKLTRSTCGSYLCGITYFYKHLCNREVDDRFGLPSLPRSKKLPQILSMEEVSRLLSCAENLKQRVLLKTIYSAGLRVSEAIRLKPEHIESDPSRMMLRIEQGKGRKDRYTVLSERLLCELREYWQKYSPGQWLFPGQKPNSHITATSVSRALYRAKKSSDYQGVQPAYASTFICYASFIQRLRPLYHQPTSWSHLNRNNHDLSPHRSIQICRS